MALPGHNVLVIIYMWELILHLHYELNDLKQYE